MFLSIIFVTHIFPPRLFTLLIFMDICSGINLPRLIWEVSKPAEEQITLQNSLGFIYTSVYWKLKKKMEQWQNYKILWNKLKKTVRYLHTEIWALYQGLWRALNAVQATPCSRAGKVNFLSLNRCVYVTKCHFPCFSWN